MKPKGLNGRRAIVIGGSMSGLCAGLCLLRHGWRVDVYERSETELSGRGAGIVAQPELIERLRSLGVRTANLGVDIATRKILDASGQVTTQRECRQVLTGWERTFRALRKVFPSMHYHQGRELVRVEQDNQSVVAYFSDGGTAEGDLLIGADGIRSSVRQQYLPDVVPLYAGYVAWRALIPEEDISGDIRAELFAGMTFCLPPGEQFLGYPVAGSDDEDPALHRRYNVVWYRPAAEHGELQRLLTDEAGTRHAISIPPPLIRAEAISSMREAAERLLAPQLRAVVRLMDEPILQPIYDIESPAMAFGRVAILGDAAFVARPHVGAGVAKAADDAAALALVLDEDDDIALALSQFEKRRAPIGRRIVAHARQLGAYLQARRPTAQERSHSDKHGIPEAVLAETALLDFLNS